MTDESATALPLHTLYTRLTGLDVPLTLPRIYAWSAWITQGWTLSDLELVIAHKKRTVHPRDRLLAHLSFSNLIANSDNFAEALSVARAASRVPKVDPALSEALRATHRPTQPESAPARSAEQVMKECEMFKAFRESL